MARTSGKLGAVGTTFGPAMSKVRTSVPDGAISLPDPAATERAGRALAYALETVLRSRHTGAAAVIGLAGSLGAGKTTLARASLHALGVEGTVRSPTYTLAEPYETRVGPIWHLDLYRIADPAELEFIAIRDLVAESVACFVEWPERGRGGLPDRDCVLAMAPAGNGRQLRIERRTAIGDAIGSRVLASLDLERPGMDRLLS